MSEWINFKSGMQPVLDGTTVTIKTADGHIETGIAESFSWKLPGYGSDIVAFKMEDKHQIQHTQRELSAREYAAIKLRVPDSGTDWLDAMIERSLLIEFTGKALSVVAPGFQQEGKEFILTADYPDAATDAHEMAHEMLKASKWGMI